MLLYELIIMQHSAEMSVFRAIVVLALIMLGQPVVKAFVHKKSKRKALKEGIKTLLLSLSAGGSNMAGVAMATASAGIIVGCVSLGLGQQITSFVEILSGGNIFLLLLITALASLLLGMGLPTTANYIIMASLTAPILVQLASGIVVHGVALAVPTASTSASSRTTRRPWASPPTPLRPLRTRRPSPRAFRASCTISVRPSCP